MKLREKKYRVDSFTPILGLLRKNGAPKTKRVISTHYYGQQDGNDVEKFVVYPDRVEAHVLTEADGHYILTESVPLQDKEAGFAWLKSRGYGIANIVPMAYTDYAYKNGTVGLYIIDDVLKSVILTYPGTHEAIEKELGLGTAEVIRVPYNTYLRHLGLLRSIALN